VAAGGSGGGATHGEARLKGAGVGPRGGGAAGRSGGGATRGEAQLVGAGARAGRRAAGVS
jgi:hypothetical protein